MKKTFLFTCILTAGILLAACGLKDNAPEKDPAQGAGESGISESVAPKTEDSSMEEPIQDDISVKQDSDYESVEGEALLSDKILSAGDTMQVLYPIDDTLTETELNITLHEAKFFHSPEEAGLDRAQMKPETENYDVLGDPVWCSIEQGNLLVCDITVENAASESGDLHIGTIMISYADPETKKVTIISCSPAYFSASSSKIGASDYLHYQLPKGESRDITAVWLIQKEYEVENLYLGITYDIRVPGERQYFQIAGQD